MLCRQLKSNDYNQRIHQTLTCPPAARCANISASLPGGRTPPTLPNICLLFLPRFDGVGMTTAGGIAMSCFFSGNKREVKRKEGKGGECRVKTASITWKNLTKSVPHVTYMSCYDGGAALVRSNTKSYKRACTCVYACILYECHNTEKVRNK